MPIMLHARLFARSQLQGHQHSCHSAQAIQQSTWSEEKKRKDYTFGREFNEKPSNIAGCPILD